MCISVVERHLFFASSLPKRAHVHGLENASAIFSEAGGNACSVVNSYCISSSPTQSTDGISVPPVLLAALVTGQSPSPAAALAVPGAPAPLARWHNCDSAGTQVAKPQMSLPSCLTTKYIHLVLLYNLISFNNLKPLPTPQGQDEILLARAFHLQLKNFTVMLHHCSAGFDS